MSKVLERIIYKRLYLTVNDNLYKSKYEFREKHNTIDAITELISEILTGLEETLAVFLDLSKALDTIDHNILNPKLEHYGIRLIALN